MKQVLERVVWENTILEYLLAVSGMLVTLIVFKLIRRRLLVLLKKITSRTKTIFDDRLIEISEKFIVPYLYLFINYSIIIQLHLSQIMQRVVFSAFMFITAFYVIRLINFIIHRSVVIYMEKKNELPERIQQVNGMLIVVKVLTWGMGIVMLADNLGYEVTTIIAGLGVGGIAIALAAQNILGDLFSYLVIFFDKPFEIGDFIKVENNSGTVEKIGIKTSHIRSLDGQQLIMPNAEMVRSVIQNFKRLERRRIVFSIGVVYHTSSGKLNGIQRIIREIVSKHPYATFDRTHLKSFGDFSINYEIVYFIESADYLIYMDTHHDICIAIFEAFEKAGIEFAFPTHTIFIGNNNGVTNDEINNYSIAKSQ